MYKLVKRNKNKIQPNKDDILLEKERVGGVRLHNGWTYLGKKKDFEEIKRVESSVLAHRMVLITSENWEEKF